MTLAPGAQLTCTGSHTITQADLDAGAFANTANAAGAGPLSQPVTAQPASATVTAAQTLHLALTKTAAPTSYSQVGQVINYTLVATNDGNITLTGVAISDPKLGTLSCDKAAPVTLAPGAQLTCTGSHTITQADLDAGAFANTANAAGAGPLSQPVTAQPASATVTAAQTLHLALTKTAAPTSYSQVGQVINYTLVATNDGNITLTGVAISDPKLGTLSCDKAAPVTLAPGAQLTCTGSHTITQADLDAGAFANTANAAGAGPLSQPVTAQPASATVTAAQTLHLALTKTAAPTSYSQVGQVINYTLVATNDGNITLTGVAISDAKLGTLSCDKAAPVTLAPSAKLTCTGSHTITQADLDAGAFANTANAAGAGPLSQPVTAQPASATVTAAQTLHLALTKTAAPTSYSQVGQVINYTLVATNDGNITLTGVGISDPKLGTLSCDKAAPVTLAPGAKLTCTGSHTITQADLDAGAFANTANAAGAGPPSQPVTAQPASATVTAAQTLHLALTKTAAPTSYSQVGQVINYTLVATNDGNITLTGVGISDAKLGTLSCDKAAPVTLAPGAKLTCTGSHTITQADLDAGAFANTANAAGAGPLSQPVTAQPASATVTAAQTLHLALTKTAAPTSYSQVGQVINYTLVATNDGNITLTGVAISDPKLGTLSCDKAAPVTLAPGAKSDLHGQPHDHAG